MGAGRWLFSMAAASSALLPAQGGVDWTLRMPASSPSPRIGHGMVYDEARGRVVLFGGLFGPPPVLYADTWEWDGTNWLQRMPTSSPGPRGPGRGMAYDVMRQRVVLYGGTTATGMFLGDSWEWDGANWTQRFPLNSPGPRDNPAMTYDRVRQRIVLYGGQLPNFQFATDTWEWDGTNWTLLDATSGPPAPYPAIAYDRVRQRIVMLFGFDTFEWTGTRWIQLSPASPPPYHWIHSMNGDDVRGRVVVFGGASPALGGIYFSRTWEWDGTDWSERFPETNPGGRLYNGMTYDSGRRRIVLFGGADRSNNFFGDTWEYGPLSPASYEPFSAGCPGSMGIPSLVAAPLSLPWIDDTLGVEVGNLVFGSPVFLVAGLSNTTWRGQPLPLSLVPFGLPAACNALVSVDAVAFAFSTGTTASFGIPICNCPTLIGTTFHHQALVIDPGGPVVSNAATGVVGGR